MSDPAAPGDLPEQTADLLETTEQLVWSLLDEQIDEAQIAQLQRLINENDAARDRYLECVQLHVDLTEHFAAEGNAPQPADGTVPVLGNLLPEGFPDGLPTPRH